MFQYKVIGNTSPAHNFAIGSIVALRLPGLTDTTAVFEKVNDDSSLQVIALRDVEPVEMGQQEAAVVLAGMVENINRRVSDAENLADQHGLSFSLNMEYGMGGTYYGTANEYLKYGYEEGWNPSSMSC